MHNTPQHAAALPDMATMPAGTHCCLLYRSSRDLADIAVPFVRAALARGELCLWLAADALLPEALSDLGDCAGAGNLEVVDREQWQAVAPGRTMAYLQEKYEGAMADGYGGLTVLTDRAGMDSVTLSGMAHAPFLSVIDLFPLAGLDGTALLDLIGLYPQAFALRDGAWQSLKGGGSAGEAGYTEVEHERMKAALRENEAFLRALLDAIPIPVFYKDCEGRYLGFNRAYEDFFGATREQLVGKSVFDISPHELAEIYFAKDRQLFEQGGVQRYESQVKNRRGELRDVIFNKAVFALHEDAGIDGLIGAILDITDRKRAESEREKMQAELLQSQKMESIGRLAGGVAHDFNNMLGVIVGYTEMALSRLDEETPLAEDLREVRKAAGRSANLIRQLLGFARKQTVTPTVLDINETVSGMFRMLRRMIGEEIELNWLPGSGDCRVCIDPGQIDQILVNLCVNASDAIEGVGEIIIEVEERRISERNRLVYPEIDPGDYILLSVSDNGHGMDRETARKAFDPFFTTKAVGKGSGLGLSTVYGIVRQNGGYIDLHSEPGLGTTFTIYLPRHAGQAKPASDASAASEPETGNETILLVEDEQNLLEVTRQMLEGCGYRVMTAATPEEGLRVGREHVDAIDLLLTDVIMPGMSGPDLVRALSGLKPSLRHMFISGYSDNAIADRSLLDEGTAFLQKPFSRKELAEKVRRVLDQDG